MFEVAKLELLIAKRNLWVAISITLMVLFTLVLTLAGSAPTGTLGVDPIIIAATSITTLSVYFVPLLALLLSFDAISGEIERGTLALSLTYPLSRAEILFGKFLAQLVVLAVAIGLALLLTAIISLLLNRGVSMSFTPLIWLFFTSILLGASFLGLGYMVSALVRQPSVASGLAIVIWLVLVILYDIGLLGALVADNGGFFTKSIFPWLLVFNPADAFRLLNMPDIANNVLSSGLGAAKSVTNNIYSFISLLLWPAISLLLAWLVFRKVEP
ncbi:MAG: ABC transporter permease [Devosiaceae bacterium]|nr:ABC transporter permease [Devosiaceae bacterium]